MDSNKLLGVVTKNLGSNSAHDIASEVFETLV